MYPSMEAKKRKRQVTVTAPSAMTPQRILEYVRVTTQETEKEVGILNSLLKSRKNKEKGDEKIDPISYPMEQVRHIKKKTARILKKASTIMLSRLPASLVDEIDSIKEEKAKAFAELIQVVESLAARKGSLASR
ncbi:uncharacterized protein LOC107303654 [Oryza brachyantha]|uniref:uncharacterized protein LOC107303654 n=1 Tax=Oryza brachyantha TaxID=4533 RepID=UPI0007768C8D|nr:uncharacterized protein LOC107303654 [Oryza brachyantha]